MQDRKTPSQQIPPGLLYTNEGLWVKVEANNRARIGLTFHLINVMTYALEGTNIDMRLPAVNASYKRLDTCGYFETQKMTVDFFAPLTGTVTELCDLPNRIDLLSRDPYGDGWLIVMKYNDPAELTQLLSAVDYAALFIQPTAPTL
jgi:glycine cleavage system H protein